MPEREIVFLGDFIDRGPDNAGVLKTVRSLMDAGKAHAVTGNHELNAVHFHTRHPGRPDQYLRSRSSKNLRQHASFLNEYPVGERATDEVIAWMKALPLFLEFDGFRVVHACWDEKAISELQDATDRGVLSEDQFIRAADEADVLFGLIETTTKGPEAPLPHGCSFTDKDGHVRTDVRVKWWHRNPTTWADIAISVPDPSDLPDGQVPEDLVQAAYPDSAKPVFFGHYWLTGEPVLQAPNALCLDYSAGKDGPLVAYRWEGGASVEINLQHLLLLDREPSRTGIVRKRFEGNSMGQSERE